MFCINCGTKLPDEASFCYSCGTAVGSADASLTCFSEPEPICEPVDVDPEVLREQKEKKSQSITILVLGILSLALGWLPGVVLAIVCRFRIKKYMEKYGELEGLALAGSYLSVAGLVVSLAALAAASAVVIFFTLYYTISAVLSIILLLVELILSFFA